MKLIIILLLISSVCFAGQQDTANKPKVDSNAIKQQQINATIQAINYVLQDMKTSLYGKISADEYALLIKLQDAYIKEKNEQFNPVPPKKK